MFSKQIFRLSMMLTLMIAFIVAGCQSIPSGDQVRTELITVEVIVTATPNPDASPEVIIITATLDRTQVAVPDGIVPETTADSSVALNTTQIPDGDIASADEDDALDVPSGCLIHVVAEGDTFFGIAAFYEVDPFIMLEINGRTEDNAFLNIGDELIVPLETCPVDEIERPNVVSIDEFLEEATEEVTAEVTAELTPEVTEEPTLVASLTPSPSPTVTLAPTAINSEIEILEVIRAGDVTAEGIRIRNNGGLVNLEGWEISDANDNSYTFGSFLFFSNAEHTVYTRASENTPIATYWGLEEPIWEVGDVVTLRDADGDVQAVLRVEDSSS